MMRANAFKKLVGAAMVAVVLGVGTVSAQGLYIDGGIGVGGGWTSIGGEDVTNGMPDDINQIGVDVGLRVGYGPLAGQPLYVVADIGGIGHRIDDGDSYVQFNSYLVGPGVIYYPHPMFQVGASVGYSFTANVTNLPYNLVDSESGFAWNISAAVDISRGRSHGFLFGLKYFGAANNLERNIAGVEQDMDSGFFGAFVRYVFKH